MEIKESTQTEIRLETLKQLRDREIDKLKSVSGNVVKTILLSVIEGLQTEIVKMEGSTSPNIVLGADPEFNFSLRS